MLFELQLQRVGDSRFQRPSRQTETASAQTVVHTLVLPETGLEGRDKAKHKLPVPDQAVSGVHAEKRPVRWVEAGHSRLHGGCA